jgi:hypothetical protein
VAGVAIGDRGRRARPGQRVGRAPAGHRRGSVPSRSSLRPSSTLTAEDSSISCPSAPSAR